MVNIQKVTKLLLASNHSYGLLASRHLKASDTYFGQYRLSLLSDQHLSWTQFYHFISMRFGTCLLSTILP